MQWNISQFHNENGDEHTHTNALQIYQSFFLFFFFASIQWLHILLYQIIHCHHSNFQIHYYYCYCAMIIIALFLFTSGAHFMISIYICVASVKLSVKKIKYSIFEKRKLFETKRQFFKIFEFFLFFYFQFAKTPLILLFHANRVPPI